ncbi:DNA-binding transcriptional regulator, FadR family [Tranquillimonas rosea]|uniref:DNA-binding transcriptional regulator, FadR family n=1 Tax=Tranquillimonas rosea TaxID=641238 RepID=A0A1H9WU40_9RHOB|nr:FadR/GntR family transcriptional regulator [Tranquillimonas rosea]SES37299.1 DNA-binding transcriptional regulator, FadR family [Tranquillimonas rosea]
MTDLLRKSFRGDTSRNSHTMVVDGLGRRIVRGDFPENSLLPRDEELAEMFGVSRTVLREAMKTLAAKGMVEPRSRVGTRVLDRHRWSLIDQQVLTWHLDERADAAFLGELFEMRLSFEPYAARLAAERAEPVKIEKMYACCDTMAESPSGQDFSIADLDLHRAIQEAAGNAFLNSVGTLIEAALLTSFRLSSPLASAAGQRESAAQHRALVDAIAAGDRDGAERAMREVIEEGWRKVRVLLSQAK